MTGLEIIEATAARYMLTLVQLRGVRRLPRHVAARKEAAYRLKQSLNLNHAQIADLLHRTPWAVWYYFHADEKNQRRRAKH